MRVNTSRFVLSAALCGAALVLTLSPARAATVSVPLAGIFNAGVSGGGTATLNSASGNFKQWLGFFHANIAVTASKQTVGLTVATVPATNYSASGSSNLDYVSDVNLGGPTPNQVNSLSADLNGGSIINFDLTVGNIVINTSLGNFNLALTFDGQVDDLDFNGTGPSAPGAFYNVPGNYDAIINGKVNGTLVGVPLIGNVSLGTLYTLPTNTLVSVPGSLPGVVALADGSGGLGPYPATLLANYAFAFPGNLSFPIDLPFAVHQTATVPNGKSGFSKLDIDGIINATLTLTNPQYNLNGSVANGVIPEPSSFALAGLGGIGLALAAWKRRRK